MTPDRHEARFLLAIARGAWAEAEAIARRRRPEPRVFLSLCHRCDVAPWVHARLEENDRLALVDDESAAALASARRKCRHDNLLLLARLEQALDALLAEQIVPVVLKGVDVIHRFGLRFDERTLDDVDMLVPAGQAARAVRALEEAGWTGPQEPERTHWLRSSFELPLRSPGPVPVSFEIHWSLGQTGRYRLDPEAVMRRTVPLDVAGRPVRRLDDHDAAAHLLVHHLQHYFDRRLKWMIDLLRIVSLPEFDWDTVVQRLREWGGTAAAAFALLHAAKVLPDTRWDDGLRRLPPAPWRRLATLPLRSAHPLDLFRASRTRAVQLWIAAALLEEPAELAGYVLHRTRRDRSPGPSPLESEKSDPGR